ncbi:aminotransferase [Clostridia bacterium]|nr:aminotransferase [Clostridia bacterium]
MVTETKVIPVTRSSMPPFDEYVDTIRQLWDTRWLTNAGTMHEDLTSKLKSYLNVGNFLLFANGHLALELAIQALELKGEVITTPFTFASTTQAIVRRGLTPVFCDIDPIRFTIDPDKAEALITEKTSAIVAVHVYGIPCDTSAIEEIAKRRNLKVIYDAAHMFGAVWQGKNIAQYGDLSMFSFHATKVFHTIEGGGLAFSDNSLYEKLRHARDFGLCPGGFDADEIGTNAKLSEFHAAMGLCNLEHIDEEIKKRKAVSETYDKRLRGVYGLQLFPEIEGLTRNYSYYPVVFHEEFGKTRDEIADELLRRGIRVRKYFYPLTSAFSCYQNRLTPKETPIAANIAGRALCLPLFADMTEENVNTVCDELLNLKGFD